MRIALVSVGAATPSQLERLLALADRLDGPVTFAPIASELVPCLRAHPALAGALAEAFANGKLAPLLAPAHGGSAALYDGQELADELRLAEELLQSLGATPPERRGAVCSGDVAALEAAGVDFVLSSAVRAPARVGERLIALPVEPEDDDDAVADAADERDGNLAMAPTAPMLILRVDGDDADALEAAGARVQALQRAGGQLVSVAALAAPLTPPWLPRVELPSLPAPPALRALHQTCRWLLDAFDFTPAPQVPALALADEGWRLDRLPARARLPLLCRRATAPTRVGLVAAFELCDLISVEARVPGRPPRVQHALGGALLEQLRAWSEAHGAGEPMARVLAAYQELADFRFLGSARWRALASGLRDTFALLSMRRDHDWEMPLPLVSVEPAETGDDEDETAPPLLRLVEAGSYN